MANIAILGTMDTKGVEHAFVAELIRKKGHQTILIDVGTFGPPTVEIQISREQVANTAGIDLASIVARKDRGESVEAMTKAAPVILQKLLAEKRIDGVISLGGGGGTAIATAAMRTLPIGFPKVMVSTLASGNTAPYVGVKDIVMVPSVVDVAGMNRISRQILTRAAGAICGMVELEPVPGPEKPVIVASQFGNTTPCVDHARKILENEGYEVLVFAATGLGGRTMESIIGSGLASGVLDITTTEWADELVGGVLNAGPTRMEAAARTGVPAIITPGCLDMVNFSAPQTVPSKFHKRNFYQHNAQVTLMRTTPEENSQLGRIIAEKANLSIGPVSVLLPLRGISIISAEGQKFHDPEADNALFAAIRDNLRSDIELIEIDTVINDPIFAEACAKTLLKNIQLAKKPKA